MDVNVPMDLVGVFDDDDDELALGAVTTCPGVQDKLCTHCGMPVEANAANDGTVHNIRSHALCTEAIEVDASVPRQAVRSMAALVRGMSDVNIVDEQPATIVAPLGWSARRARWPRSSARSTTERRWYGAFRDVLCTRIVRRRTSTRTGRWSASAPYPVCYLRARRRSRRHSGFWLFPPLGYLDGRITLLAHTRGAHGCQQPVDCRRRRAPPQHQDLRALSELSQKKRHHGCFPTI